MKHLKLGKPVEDRVAFDGERARYLRRQSGVSLVAFADLISKDLGVVAISHQSVANWELGRCAPPEDVARAIAKRLKVRSLRKDAP